MLRGLSRTLLAAALALAVVWAGSLGVVADVRGSDPPGVSSLRIANEDMQRAALDAEAELWGLLGADDAVFLERYEVAVDAFDEASQRALAHTDDPEATQGIEGQRRVFGQWVEEFAGPAVWLRESSIERGRVVDPSLARSGSALSDELEAQNRAVDEQVERIAIQQQARRAAAIRLATTGTIIVVVITAVIIGLARRHLHRHLNRPLDRLESTLRQLTAGRLDARVEPTGMEDIGRTASSVNRLAADNERMTLDQESRDRHDRLMRDVTAQIRSGIGSGDLLRRTAETVGPVVSADRVVVREVEVTTGETRLAEWNPSHGPEATPDPRPEASFDRVLDAPTSLLVHGAVVEIADTQDEADERLTAGDRAACAVHDSRSVLLVPACHDGRVAAVVVLHRARYTAPWPAEDVHVARTAAEELGFALGFDAVMARERETAEQLRELEEAESELVATVSHELRTPLTSVRNAVEVICDGDAGPLTAVQRRMLSVTTRNLQRLDGLVENLLTGEQTGSQSCGSLGPEVDLGEVILDVLGECSSEVRELELALRIEVDRRSVMVAGDHDQLRRMVTNLLSNALKFSESGGVVTVCLQALGNRVRLAVADSGIGIPLDEQDRLFTRFYRSTLARDRSIDGTGLGLSIVKDIVEAHEGSIEVRSAEGLGTRFTVWLPRSAVGLERPGPNEFDLESDDPVVVLAPSTSAGN